MLTISVVLCFIIYDMVGIVFQFFAAFVMILTQLSAENKTGEKIQMRIQYVKQRKQKQNRDNQVKIAKDVSAKFNYH